MQMAKDAHECPQIDEQSRRKLRCHFGLNENDIQLYAYFQHLNLAKIKQLLGRTPTLNEVLVLKENFLNRKVEALLMHWNAEEKAAKSVSSSSSSKGCCAQSPNNCHKCSQLLGVSPNDLSYYSRYGKAVRILGDAPVRILGPADAPVV